MIKIEGKRIKKQEIEVGDLVINNDEIGLIYYLNTTVCFVFIMENLEKQCAKTPLLCTWPVKDIQKFDGRIIIQNENFSST